MNIPDHVPDHVPTEIVVDESYQHPCIGSEDPMAELGAKYRKEYGEIFYTSDTRRGQSPHGHWVVTSDEMIKRILRDAETFSSVGISGFGKMFAEGLSLLPLEIDPPLQTDFRRAMAGFLSPKRIAHDIEPQVRAMAVSLIEGIAPNGQCEFTRDFATPFPIKIFMGLMGIDLDRFDEFLSWEDTLLRGKDQDARIEVAHKIRDYLIELMDERRANPKDDLVSDVVRMQVDNRPISDAEALGVCYLFFVGGLDTVAATLGYIFRYLAKNPEVRRQLIDEPSLVVPATEEMLRRFSVVPTRRLATRDVELGGYLIKKGDYVECDLSIANTCPVAYEKPLELDFDRGAAHIAFSVGPHRCMGSHLARLELHVAIEEWLKRIPDFEIEPSAQLCSHYPSVKGLRSLPLNW